MSACPSCACYQGGQHQQCPWLLSRSRDPCVCVCFHIIGSLALLVESHLANRSVNGCAQLWQPCMLHISYPFILVGILGDPKSVQAHVYFHPFEIWYRMLAVCALFLGAALAVEVKVLSLALSCKVCHVGD